MILFADSETTGLVRTELPDSHPRQPHLVQLGLVLATDDGCEVASAELIVRPEGYVIPEEAARVHGITQHIAQECGIPLIVAVAVFTNLRANATQITGHNFRFDDLVLRAAIHRTGRKPSSPGPELKTCTMELASPVVNLPPTPKMIAAGFTKPKPPTLTETVRFLFGEELQDAHSALADARACMRVYFELKRREPPTTEGDRT